MVVDAHHHLWDQGARRYPFLEGPATRSLRRRYGVAELGRVAAACGVDCTVLIQSLPDHDESIQLLDDATQTHGLIAAVVGWVDLTADDVADQLDRLAESHGGALLRGVRHPVQAEADPHWLDRAQVRRGLNAVAQRSLSYDLLVKQPHWAAATRLAREWDGPLVLDHAGNPPVCGDLAPWTRWIRHFASSGEHVHVKLSGLVTLVCHRGVGSKDVMHVFETLIEAFGPQRMMAGSDWPICELAMSAKPVWDLHAELVAQLRPAERAEILDGTATRFYRLRDGPGWPALDGERQ